MSAAPTAQTKCDDNNGNVIVCPSIPSTADCATTDYCGQDAQYPDAPRTFTPVDVAGEVIVKDSLTGLEWMQKCAPFAPITESAAATYCSTLSYASQTGWRVPSVSELVTIIDHSGVKPTIDPIAFPSACGMGTGLWTSTKYAGDPNNKTFCTVFDDGRTVQWSYPGQEYVRCVRGPAATEGAGRFVSEGTGQVTVTDLKTGLVWQASDVKGKSWVDALKSCEGLAYAGQSDWRLPNVNELQTLVDYSIFQPASTFPGMPSERYWTSTSNGGVARWVDLSTGDLYQANKLDGYSVRCVRGPI
jgi:hypothetical protein